MTNISTLDRKLISLLKNDGRASVTNLAVTLGVSRVTIQSRLDRLKSAGIIKRFTVELDAAADIETIRSIMMIEIEGTLARSVNKALNNIPEIISLHTTNGIWDLIAEIETSNLPEFDRILSNIREIKGVLNSQTSILLNKAPR